MADLVTVTRIDEGALWRVMFGNTKGNILDRAMMTALRRIGRDRRMAAVAKHLRSWQGARDRPQPAVAFGKSVGHGLPRLPDPPRGVQSLDRRAGGRGRRRPARLAKGGRGVVGVHQALAAQVIEHRAPVAIPEGVDDDPPLLQQQRDGSVGGAMARRRNVRPLAAIVEIAAQGLDDGSQGHGDLPGLPDQNSPTPGLPPPFPSAAAGRSGSDSGGVAGASPAGGGRGRPQRLRLKGEGAPPPNPQTDPQTDPDPGQSLAEPEVSPRHRNSQA